MCKKCKKAFRKDMANYEESDEYCPHCDNHYVRRFLVTISVVPSSLSQIQVLEAKTPQAVVGVEGDDARVDNRQASVTTFLVRRSVTETRKISIQDVEG